MKIKKVKSTSEEYDFIFLLIIGLSILFLIYHKYEKDTQSNNWPTINGIITISTIETKYIESENGTKIKQYPRIEYDYFVNSEKFHGTIYGNIKGHVYDIVGRHSIGEEVKVYYNPHNPKESLLNPGFNFGPYIFFIFIGLLVVFLGIVRLYLKIKTNKSILHNNK